MRPGEFTSPGRTKSLMTHGVFGTGFVAVFGLLCWMEYANWQVQVERVETTLQQTAEGIAQHADDILEMCRLPLASLISEIANDDGKPGMAEDVGTLIDDLLKASPTIRTLSYIDATGKLVVTSGPSQALEINYADRDYFRYHKSSNFPLPVLGKPVKSRVSGEWVLPVSQRVNRKDASFGGVVVSTIPVNHFINFFRNYNIGADASFLLLRGDGIILARGPMLESLLGSDVSGHDIFTHHLKGHTNGAYLYRSPVDDTDRLGGFYQSGRTGIVALAAASQADTFRNWMETAQIRWAYAAVLLLVALLAYAYWRRQARLKDLSDALLRAREAEFRMLADFSSDVISRFNEDGIREYVSPSSREILGLEPADLVGRSVFASMDAESAATAMAAAERMKAGSLQEEILTRHAKPDGEEIWLNTALSRLPDMTGKQPAKVVAISRDVTRHKLMQDRLDRLAHSDDLTGLANRRQFNARLKEMLALSRREATPLSLLMIDADRFKLYNDTYGHAAGDECLRQIAAVVRQAVIRDCDLAARYGGEELAVLLLATDAGGAVQVAEAIRSGIEALGMAHQMNAPSGRVTVSIGAATLTAEALAAHFPAGQAALGQPASGQGASGHGASGQTIAVQPAEVLFAEADAALYEAKSAGRNRVVCAGKPPFILRSAL